MDLKKVIVVDDEPDIREMLEALFQTEGYQVHVFEDGETALPQIQMAGPCVLFFDLKLPSMSGLDLCREVRTFNSIAIIYAMTGYTSLFELSDCREAGFDDFFVKPISSSLFLRATKQAFEKLDRWSKKK